MTMIPKVTNRQTNITFLSIRDLAESSPRPCCSGSKALLSEVFRDFLIIIIIIQCTAVVKQCNVIPWAKLLTKVLLKKVFRPVLRGQCHQNRLSHSYIWRGGKIIFCHKKKFYDVVCVKDKKRFYEMVLKTRRILTQDQKQGLQPLPLSPTLVQISFTWDSVICVLCNKI